MVDANETRKTSSIPEITPLDRYDFGRAKICASVRWLLVTAYGSGEGVPADLQEPLSRDAAQNKQEKQKQKEEEQLKPAVARLLLSCELYRRAYASVQQGAPAAEPKDHGGLLQALAKRGLEAAVSEGELSCQPIKVGAHMAVIDAMMTLATMETVGGVKMAKEVDQFGGGSTWENSLLFWVNKLIQKLRESTDTEGPGEVQKPQPTCTDLQPVQPSHAIAFCLKESGNKPPVIRYRKDKVQSKQTPTFPFVSELKDLSNGCAIATVLHFYCPTLLRLEDVCLKDTMSVADSLYNLQLIRNFCESWLKGCCPLVLEDLLYTPQTLKLNIMCFMAELLKWFEVLKPDIVQPSLTLDLTDASGLDGCTSPMNGNSNSGSPSFIFKQPFLPITSPVSPAGGSEGKGWSKKQLSRPLSAVAFSIPFPLDSDVDVVMGNKVFRSVSTDSLTATVTARPAHHPYTPPEDLSHMIPVAPMGELPTIEEALHLIHAPNGSVAVRQRPEGAPAGFYLHSRAEEEEGEEEEGGRRKAKEGSKLSCSAPCRSMLRRPVGVDSDGTAAAGASPVDPSPPVTPSKARMTSFAERRRRQPESPAATTPSTPDCDGTSSPRRPTPRVGGLQQGGTVGGQDGEEDSPSVSSPAGQAEAWELASRLEEKRRAIESQKRRIEAIFTRHRQRLGKTAFLQLKREQGEGEGGENEGAGGGGGGGEVDSMSLEERLSRMEEDLQREEEKEREEKGSTEEKGKEKEKESVKKEEREKEGEKEGGENAGGGASANGLGAAPKLEKQVTFSVETRNGEEKESSSLSQYDEAVTKLSSALQALQKDMLKLTEQQQRLMGPPKKAAHSSSSAKTTPSRKTPPPSKAWVITASPKASATPPHLSRESTRDISPSSSPSRSAPNHGHAPPTTTPKSPQATPANQAAATAARKTPKSPSSTATKSPRRQQQQQQRPPARPSDLRFPSARVLTTTHSVDTLPHLRRVSPSKCQVQTASSLRFGGPQTPPPPPPQTPTPPTHAPQLPKPQESASESVSSDEHVAMFSLELEAGATPPPPPAAANTAQGVACANVSGAVFPRPPGSVAGGSSFGGGSSSGAPSECSFDSDLMISAGLTDGETEVETDGGGGGDSERLLEAALSSLEGPLGGGEETDQEQGPEVFSSDSMSDQTESETRGGVGFYFREEGMSEKEMAQRKAALLERQQRRAEEMRRRRQEQERENSRASSTDELRLSQSLPTSSFFAPPPAQHTQATPPSTPQRRGDFTREEYGRRRQLKIMSDLGKVLQEKPSASKQHKQQQQQHKPQQQQQQHKPQQQQQQNKPQQHKPQQHKPRGNKSRGNNVAITRSPAKATMDSSVAAAMTNGPQPAVKPPSHSNSPSDRTMSPGHRTMSPGHRTMSPSHRTMSPGRLANQNGDKDWENGSGASSPASLPEYTGPKLYREPSFKSNKFIINNALSRCCLAGRVNQPHKDKMIEEIEKSSANHFLILFRDAHCQFRAVYTAAGGNAGGNAGGAGGNSGESPEELVRLCGVGPRVISCADVEAIYKYSSDRKQFSAIPSKTMSMSVDAFTIPAHLWQAKKQGTPKKAATPK
ncbi:calmodulin-regulated spectrin-associated protein 3 isoform X2 [Clupea harengus]|uniref:Calmodulin-regulated spectrin-associated protein 3 isoform X2 n=1 Tax=Clupea harengus TaxID=7950 RepID=A0A8M1K6F9_CLUHA|nr:calmodulin-regulated spectrin-associated protein 3 isoform X2 [Clupea harengus]